MYALSDDGTLQPLGEPVIIGQVSIKAEVQGDGDSVRLGPLLLGPAKGPLAGLE